jgi:ABC-type uncharacterized transport system permease subunit
MHKYLYRFRNAIEAELEYRSNMVSRSLVTLLKVASFFVLWLFIFKSTDSIGGLSFDQTLLYYSLIPLVGLITMASVDTIGKDISTGFISNLLLKPYRLWVGAFLDSFAIKLVSLIAVGPFYLIIVSLLLVHFKTPINWGLMGVAVLIAFSAYILNFFIEIGVNLSAFWLEEVWAFRHARNIIFGILGGLSFPFDFLSQNVRNVFELLPFKILSDWLYGEYFSIC